MMQKDSKNESPDLVTCYLTLLRSEAGRVILDGYFVSRISGYQSLDAEQTQELKKFLNIELDQSATIQKETQV